MENPRAQSFKPLKISTTELQASTAQHETLTKFAAGRAKLLLGCYRTGEANDPQTYVAAITAILARYPEEVITSVTHPATGLPSKKSWLPTVKEVVEACDEAYEPMRQNEARLKRIKDQLETREREARGERPSYAQMQEKYGNGWGLGGIGKPKDIGSHAPTIDQLRFHYQHHGLGFKPKQMGDE